MTDVTKSTEAADRPGLGSLIEDLFGLNVRGLQPWGNCSFRQNRCLKARAFMVAASND